MFRHLYYLKDSYSDVFPDLEALSSLSVVDATGALSELDSFSEQIHFPRDCTFLISGFLAICLLTFFYA